MRAQLDDADDNINNSDGSDSLSDLFDSASLVCSSDHDDDEDALNNWNSSDSDQSDDSDKQRTVRVRSASLQATERRALAPSASSKSLAVVQPSDQASSSKVRPTHPHSLPLSGTDVVRSRVHEQLHLQLCDANWKHTPAAASLRTLALVNLSCLNLQRLQFGAFVKSLSALPALRAVDLSDNQLDDANAKDLRALLTHPSLERLDVSRNRLGRASARVVCERLKRQCTLQRLDLHGNCFFDYDDALDVAQAFAQGAYDHLVRTLLSGESAAVVTHSVRVAVWMQRSA